MTSKADFVVALIVFCLAAIGSSVAQSRVNPAATAAPNVWFQADSGRVYKNMTERYSNHYRTKVHPLFSLATHPVVHGASLLGIDKAVAVRALVAAVAGLVLAMLFAILRVVGTRLFDALVYTALLAGSASALMFSAVPETFLFGSLTILVVVLFAALSERRRFPPFVDVGVSALSLSMTVTNWVAGMLGTFSRHPLRQTIRITVDAFAVVTVLWAVQHALYPSSEFFLLSPEERDYIFSDDAGSMADKAVVFFLHSVIAPGVEVLPNRWTPDWPLFSVQRAAVGTGGALGWPLAVGWTAMLALGLWAMWKDPANRRVKIVVASTVLFQFALHMVYGDETFLYSLHWVPLLVLIASFGAVPPYRRYALVLAIACAIGFAANNAHQFERIAARTWG